MAGEAPVYRSSRLHSVNPTAAVSEDTSYLYTLVGWSEGGWVGGFVSESGGG